MTRPTVTRQHKEIDRITDDFQSTFAGLTPNELNWKPDLKTWSIAQNLDHIITVNESYYPVIDSVRKGTYKLPFLGRLGFMTRFFGNLIRNSVSPDRKRKSRTFSIWEPRVGDIDPGIVSRFQKHQKELKNYIENSRDLTEKGAVISSPANRMIVYKMDTAFEILIDHEKRHLNQARELLEMMKK
jgi:hypothetical protein